MKCAVHSEVDATGFCRNCGKALCAECARPIRGTLYCEDCLASSVGIPAAAPPPAAPPPAAAPASPMPGYSAPAQPAASTAGSPGVAFVLGFFPGLGAVYNGEYNKALIHMVIFITLVVGLSSDVSEGIGTALGLSLAGFILYAAVDAMRVAKAKRLGQPVQDPLEGWSKDRPIGPVILIGLGVLFLLDNLNILSFHRIFQFWPIVLIAVGILMFRNRLAGRS